MKTPISKSIRFVLYPALNLTLATLALFLLAAVSSAHAQGNDNRVPDVPANLVVPDDNKVHFHVYAVGVQIYAWNGSSWVFQAPEAVGFANGGGDGEVAIHYVGPTGPTWESESGSTVAIAKVAGATVDPTAIPWLLLRAASNGGHGIFASVTFIQRVNTAGGLAPAAPGTSVGEVARVPYTAEYFFYRAAN